MDRKGMKAMKLAEAARCLPLWIELYDYLDSKKKNCVDTLLPRFRVEPKYIPINQRILNCVYGEGASTKRDFKSIIKHLPVSLVRKGRKIISIWTDLQGGASILYESTKTLQGEH